MTYTERLREVFQRLLDNPWGIAAAQARKEVALMGPRDTRLSGHGRVGEGQVAQRWQSDIEGQAICECGTASPTLPDTKSRLRWHRVHKASLLQEISS